MNLALYVLARPSFSEEFVRFLGAEKQSWSQTGGSAAERLTEFAGRICYMSFGSNQSPKSNSAYLRNLIRNGHESVLEHVSWTFLLTGVSRAFTHQLVRHRVGVAYSQLSQQYHDERDASFVRPDGIESDPDLLAAWQSAVESSRKAYQMILQTLSSSDQQSKESVRAIKSAARSVLPNATETKIVFTANARAIRHILASRGAIEGDFEMRHVSKLIFEVVVADAPSLFPDFQCDDLPDGPIIRRVDISP